VNCFRAGAKLPVGRITQKINTRKEHQMDYQPKNITRVEQTCVVCREEIIEQIFGEVLRECLLPGELRSQFYTVFYGMCKKCTEDDDAREIFEIMMLIYDEML
jgi:hypothetical protein